MITTSYHDLLTMYGDEQREAEQRVHIYVQQPQQYKMPEDIARFSALQKQYPGIASVKDVARRSWERK